MTLRYASALLLSSWALLACDAERARIDIDVPRSARGRITEVWVGVFPPSAERCTDLAFWATGSCGRDCADVPPPLDRAAAQDAFTLRLGASGRFGNADVALSAGDAWEVVVVAEVEGSDPLYGCRLVRGGTPATLSLFWPWCSARVCDRLYHPACGASIVCAPEPLVDPLMPDCEVDRPQVDVWTQGGRPCDPPAFSGAACRPATFACEPGQLTPIEDGLCPDFDAEEMCVTRDGTYLVEADLNCDGAHPLCESMACTDDTRRSCGDGECMGVAVCVDGTFSECVYGGSESCNGLDDDCDGAFDEGRDAVSSCSRSRTIDAPGADACVDGSCRCGRGEACANDEACCDQSCIALATDTDHCGGCGNACAAGQSCIRGTCSGGLAPLDGGTVECSDVAQCNLTHQAADECEGGRCLCGGEAPCELPSLCCQGVCVDVSSDVENCGVCGRGCRPCVDGLCR